MGGPQRSPRPALLITLLAFLALGLADGLLGTVWPDMRDSFDRGNASFGMIFASLSGGYLVASAASGHVSDRRGFAATLSIGTTTAVAGVVVLATAPLWWMVLAGFMLLGIGGGLTDATANSWVALAAGPREMGALHTAYGLGATGGPLLATAFIANQLSWRGPFVVLLVVQLAVAATVIRGRAGFATKSRSSTIDTEQAGSAHRPALVASGLLVWFGLYVGVEIAIGSWSYTVLTEGRGVSEVVAGVMAASFWIGMTIGRLALAAFGDRVDPASGVSRASAGAIVAALFFWLDPGGLGGLALPSLGVCFSVMFPLGVLLTPRYLDEERAPRQVGYQLASSSLGAIVVPASIGVFAESHGVDIAVPISAAIVITMSVIWAAVRWEAETSRQVS